MAPRFKTSLAPRSCKVASRIGKARTGSLVVGNAIPSLSYVFERADMFGCPDRGRREAVDRTKGSCADKGVEVAFRQYGDQIVGLLFYKPAFHRQLVSNLTKPWLL